MDVPLRASLVVASLAALLVAGPAWGESQAAEGTWLMADARWQRSVAVRYVSAQASPETAPVSLRSGTGGDVAVATPDLPRLWLTRSVDTESRLTAAPLAGASVREALLPSRRDLGLFLAAQSTLWVDALQTLEIGGAAEYAETNAILGESPSDGAVIAYFGSVSLAHALTYLTMGPRWANLVSRAILFVQVPAIDNNARLGVRIAF